METQSVKTEKKVRRRGAPEKYLFKSGKDWTGNKDGRPKGSVSIVGRAKELLRKDPARLNEIAENLLKDKKLRIELIRQIDGMPKQTQEIKGDKDSPLVVKIVKFQEDARDNNTL